MGFGCRWEDAPLLRRDPHGVTSSPSCPDEGQGSGCLPWVEGVERGSGGGDNRGQPEDPIDLPRPCPDPAGDRLLIGIAGVKGGVDGLQGNTGDGKTAKDGERTRRQGRESLERGAWS
jgi:hypothetical protein